MSVRNYSILAFAVLGLHVLASGQNPPAPNSGTAGGNDNRSTPAPALTGVIGIDSPLPEQDSSASLPPIPAVLGGPRLSVALRSESERSNTLRAGVNVGATYDDNALLTPHNELGNTTYSVFPNLSLEQVRSRRDPRAAHVCHVSMVPDVHRPCLEAATARL